MKTRFLIDPAELFQSHYDNKNFWEVKYPRFKDYYEWTDYRRSDEYKNKINSFYSREGIIEYWNKYFKHDDNCKMIVHKRYPDNIKYICKEFDEEINLNIDDIVIIFGIPYVVEYKHFNVDDGFIEYGITEG